MGTITSGVGLVSGINTTDIINQLMKLEERPKLTLQTRIESTNKQKLALVDLSTQLASLKLYMTAMKKPSAFTSAKATSSNEQVLTATTTGAPTPGSYQFQVARLVTSQQAISNGFADYTTASVGAGTITIEQGGGDLTTSTALGDLKGATGAGVRRGQFRLTDRSGRSAVIDISAAVSLDDVVKKINTTIDVSVRASVDGDGLKLTDLSGGTGNLSVLDVGTSTAAADLGIAKNVAAATMAGDSINGLSRSTLLSQLNDGRGVRKATSGADLRVSFANGGSYDINLSSANTVGEMLDTINKASPANLRAEIAPDGHSFRLIDVTGAGGEMSVTALNGSNAAADLGFAGATGSGQLDGGWVLSKLNTVLLSTLNGGRGMAVGSIMITNRAGGPDTTVDLTGAKTVQDVLDSINNAGAGVTASLKSSGNGIQLTDTTGGSNALSVYDIDDGTMGDALGIAGVFNASNVQGKNLQRQWVTENSLLSTYNGGKGVTQGTIKLTNSQGKVVSVNLSGTNVTRIGDVIKSINSANAGVTASINANGDGLLLTDTAGGTGKLLVDDVSGTAAADLNIKGQSLAAAGTIDGSFEKTITVSSADTLTTLQKKITDLNFGIQSQIINDGTTSTPYRLSMTAKNTGVAGRVVLDMGTTSIQSTNLVEAQDAAVFVGGAGAGAGQPLLITASRNQIGGVIAGVNLDLHGVSSSPVNLDVARNIDSAVEQMTKFAEGFNTILDKIAELTKFDAATGTKGLLLGDATVRGIADQLYFAINSSLKESGRFKVLSDVGMKIVSGGRLEFDEEKFRTAYATDGDSVQRLFTHMVTTKDASNKDVITGKGLGYVLENAITRLIDPVNGTVTQQNKTLDSRTTTFQTRINTLDKLLATKRLRLEKQFAQMESVLSQLQSQQSSLSSIQSLAATTAA